MEFLSGDAIRTVDTSSLLERAIKYLVEGLAIAVVAYYIPRRQMSFQEIAMIALTGAATFAVLDMFAPGVARGARQGAGFGIGASQVGYKGLGAPGL